MDPTVDYAEYLRQKYHLGEVAQEEGYERPSTADFSDFTHESDLYVERRPAQRPRTSSNSNLSNAERLSRNKAAKKAVTDVTTYNHISNLYHLNRRIQEMHNKSGRKGYSTPGRVGTVDAAELGSIGDRPAWDSRPGTGSSAYSGSRPGTASTPRIAGAPSSPPSPHRPLSAPSPFRQNPLFPPAGGGGRTTQRQQQQQQLQQQRQQRQLQRPATSMESWGCDGDGSGRSSSLAEPPVAPVASFTERRIKNTAQSLKTAILNEIIENRIYEEKRLKQLFRSYMKLNSGEAFYPTLCSVIDDLKQELDVK